MSTDWMAVPDESWHEEISQYLPRLEAAGMVGSRVRNAQHLYWPGVFWPDSPPSRPASIAVRLGIYSVGLFSIARLVRSAVREHWLAGLFVIVPLTTRFLFEIWGALHFAQVTLSALLQGGDLAPLERRAMRLMLGSRSHVLLPWGQASEESSFNVAEFVRTLRDVCPDAEDLYAFLSEASHPSFVQNTYFQMAGPPAPNWRNARFREHAHALLNKTLEIVEIASEGTEDDLLVILEEGTRFIQASS